MSGMLHSLALRLFDLEVGISDSSLRYLELCSISAAVYSEWKIVPPTHKNVVFIAIHD
jgi:hypothetical protein